MKHLYPHELLKMAEDVARRFPTAELVKNSVGNLSIHVDGEYVGFIDLKFAEVVQFQVLGQ